MLCTKCRKEYHDSIFVFAIIKRKIYAMCAGCFEEEIKKDAPELLLDSPHPHREAFMKKLQEHKERLKRIG